MRQFLLLLPFLLTGCFSTPPIEVNNICDVLDEHVSWYKAVKKTEQQWGVPKSLQLAFIHQESRFASDAQPAREKLFGVVPWLRSSSAYGYAQVKNKTWQWYQQKTGNSGASRDDFADASDFIGWYVNFHHTKLRISKDNAYAQYLAYHEGHNGFKNKTYQQKGWLINVAKSVQKTAHKYKAQIKQCQAQLDSNYSWSFF